MELSSIFLPFFCFFEPTACEITILSNASIYLRKSRFALGRKFLNKSLSRCLKLRSGCSGRFVCLLPLHRTIQPLKLSLVALHPATNERSVIGFVLCADYLAESRRSSVVRTALAA
jgi:hypothetical protein